MIAVQQLKKTLPGPVLRPLRSSYRFIRGIAPGFRTLWQHGRPEVVLYFGASFGDDLMCTAVLRELSRRGVTNVWMMSKYPDLFVGNSDVRRIVPLESWIADAVQFLGAKYHSLHYGDYDKEADRSVPPRQHIIAEMCSRARLQGTVSLRPYLHLQPEEVEKWVSVRGRIAFQSAGLSAKWPMRNKQWFPERFQEVVRRLKPHCEFVQLGGKDEQLLEGALDLRGNTSIRETAAILHNASLFVGTVGFLMHLARAVECPGVIVFGGREAPWQSGYPCNENLYSAVPCAPCWLWNRCDHDRVCLQNISVEMVVRAIERRLNAARGPLAVDEVALLAAE